MAPQFVKVCGDEEEQVIELPLEDDGTLLLSTINTLFPSANGLKYENAMGSTFISLKCIDGKIYPPSDGGWGKRIFWCTQSREYKNEKENGTSHFSRLNGEKKQCTDIIVLGMAWKTDEASMREYFSQYGELAMVQLKRHPASKQSKGFGFIRFVEYGAQISCLSERHLIDGRWCEVKIPESKTYADKQEVIRKVYVGGLSEDISLEALKDTFSQYGCVTDVFIPKPFRSFAFVTFADSSVAQSLLNKQITCGGYPLNIQAAAPKLPTAPRQHRHMDYYGLHGSQDQNAIALAALNMLKDPHFFNSVLSLANSTGQPNNNMSHVAHLSGSHQMNQFGLSGTKFH